MKDNEVIDWLEHIKWRALHDVETMPPDCTPVIQQDVKDTAREYSRMCDFLIQILKLRHKERSGTLRLLRRLEWGDDGSGFLVCPCCDRAKGGGHAQDCELDAAIRKGDQT